VKFAFFCARCFGIAGFVAARFIAHINGGSTSIQALRNKLRRYGMCGF
jgi:hypothetical protein